MLSHTLALSHVCVWYVDTGLIYQNNCSSQKQNIGGSLKLKKNLWFHRYSKYFFTFSFSKCKKNLLGNILKTLEDTSNFTPALVLEVFSSPLGINTRHRIATGSFSRSVFCHLGQTIITKLTPLCAMRNLYVLIYVLCK